MLSMDSIRSIISRTLSNGGGTFNPSTGDDVKHGIACAIIDYTLATLRPDELTDTVVSGVLDIIERNWPGANIGTWLDTATGFVHIDPVSIFDSVESAIAYGLEHHQLAVFDIDRMEEIRIA